MAAKKAAATAVETNEEDSSREREESRSGRDTSRQSSFKARSGDRLPMGGYTQQLQVTGIPEGYVARWINDDGSRIQQALNAGYIPVYKDGSLGDVEVSGGDLAHEDEWTSKPVGETQYGKLIAYLMAIRKEWYEENQALKRADGELFDKAIAEGKSFDPQGKLVDSKTTYSEANIKHEDLKR